MLPARHYVSNNWLPTLFNDFFDTDWLVQRTASTSPAVNVIEDEKGYKVEVAAPGMTKDDFKVTLDENENLVISMEKKQTSEEGEKHARKYLRREFSYAKFQQTMSLPEDVQKEAITAQVTDGVLSIELPKKELKPETPARRMIEIR